MTPPNLPEAAKLARQLFHRHLQSRGIPSVLFQHDGAGTYGYATVQNEWQVWQAAHAAALAASAEPMEPAWMTAFDDARDAILHDRHALAEEGMTNDQTNAVLSILDDAFMPHLKRGAVETSESVISPKSKLMMLDKLAKGRGFRNATEALASLARATPPAQAEPSAQESAEMQLSAEHAAYVSACTANTYGATDEGCAFMFSAGADYGRSLATPTPQTSASVAAPVQAPAEGARDAVRYRYLRSTLRTPDEFLIRKTSDGSYWLSGTAMDKAIDAKMQADATPQPQPPSPEQAPSKEEFLAQAAATLDRLDDKAQARRERLGLPEQAQAKQDVLQGREIHTSGYIQTVKPDPTKLQWDEYPSHFMLAATRDAQDVAAFANDRWCAEQRRRETAVAERDALTAELHEQARQNGMGSEREARLMARVAELEKAGAPMANTMFNLAQREHWPAFERASFKAMQVAWDSASSAAGEANP